MLIFNKDTVVEFCVKFHQVDVNNYTKLL